MEFKGRTIRIDRELSSLDKFTLDFIKVLEKHTRYVVISGYVAILLGRSRASEDVDIIIPSIGIGGYKKLSRNLKKSGFYCLNAEDIEEQYGYIKEKIALRFARNDTVIPNIELKCQKTEIDKAALNDTLTVQLGRKSIIISNLELQIAFKEKILGSHKDLEDARHIRNIAKGHLEMKKLEEYEASLDGFYR